MTKMLELLDKSSKWTKGVNARDKNGKECNARQKKAVCFCLNGALNKCYPRSTTRERAEHALEEACKELFPRRTGKCGWRHIAFNDSKATTFADVRKVLKKANV